MTIRGVLHVGLTVTDADRSIAFYRDNFGFELLSERVAERGWVEAAVGVENLTLRIVHLHGHGYNLELLEYRHPRGATRARVEGAQAAHEQTVALYRQTVLTAFQNVEDQLAATRVLAQQQELRRQASQAADEAEANLLNQYRAGRVSFIEVFTAQASALTARRALVQLEANRQVTAISLIQSLGGGWHIQQ